jgi:hypothetical protein
MKRLFLSAVLLVMLTVPVRAEPTLKGPLAPYLQDVSVTIKSTNTYGNSSQGSGVIVTRELVSGDKKIKVNFIWTAGHVISHLRTTRKMIDPKSGTERQVIEFKDASIVKELVEDGRRVGEVNMDARVLKYSDSETGEDLALLMVRKRGFVDVNTEFHVTEPVIIDIGTKLFHVGSLMGQLGANSMTSGIMSQVGRVMSVGSGGGVIFDQTTATAFPGSSGGGIFIAGVEDGLKDHRGKYCGMLVRGAGETFNLMVPIRRMKAWAKNVGVEWALDKSIPLPLLADLNSRTWQIEDSGVEWSEKSSEDQAKCSNKLLGLHFWLRDSSKPGLHLLPQK